MSKRKLRYAVAGVMVAADVVVITMLAMAFKYDDKWYPNTVINGIDVSGMSYEESLDAICGSVEDYCLQIKGRDDAYLTIEGDSISLAFESNNEIAKLYNQTHDTFSVKRLFSEDNYEVSLNISIDMDRLSQIINESEMVNGSDTYQLHQPINARVEYSDEEGRAVIVPEIESNVIVTETLSAYVVDAIEQLETQMDITDNEKYPDVYKAPAITQEADTVLNTYHDYNALLFQWLTWDMGEGAYETITPDDIKDWLKMDQNGNVSMDKDKMAEWIESFCLKYKTLGTTRKFTTHDGREIEVSGGDYGWRIDYEATVDAAYEQLTENKEWGVVESYINDPTDDNKEKLTTVWEPSYSNTAFKKDYSDFMYDWDPDNYSEIDLTEQMVYVYKDGELAYECKCVTGLPSDPERKTRTGCWYIKEKKESYVLTGADYSTPTKYWIRIMWTGTGYHYMNRKDWSSWTPDLYKTKGSHGCINLQYDDAKALYGLIDFYDAVFIHE